METEHLPEEEHHDKAHEQPRLWAGTLSTNDRARHQTSQHHPQTGAQLEENPWVRRGITWATFPDAGRRYIWQDRCVHLQRMMLSVKELGLRTARPYPLRWCTSGLALVAWSTRLKAGATCVAVLHQRASRAPEITTEDMFIMVRSEARPWTGSCLSTWRGKGWQKSWQAEKRSAGCEAGALCCHFSKMHCFSAGQRLSPRQKGKRPS